MGQEQPGQGVANKTGQQERNGQVLSPEQKYQSEERKQNETLQPGKHEKRKDNG